jgi:hypothetical protein
VICDVMVWANGPDGCSRCATVAPRYIEPYYAPDARLCPACCQERNTHCDSHDCWPQNGRMDNPGSTT